MCTGLDNTDLDKTKDLRKTAIIDRELKRLNVDVAALQETRLADTGSVSEANFTFFWQGLRPEDRRLYGVGFAVNNKLLKKISTPQGISERIMTMQLTTKSGTIHLISAYAPTLAAESEVKDKFYEDLQKAFKQIPEKEDVFILGDFNARVGSEQETWPTCLGHFGMGKMNENGQRLLEFCSNNHLCITNTFYNGKDRHRVSWRHPRSGHWHQIDFVIVRKRDLNSVKSTRSFHSADCNTDHLLILTKTKLISKSTHRSERPKKPKINLTHISDSELKSAFQNQIEDQLLEIDESCPEKMWTCIKTAIYGSASQVFGESKISRTDWIEANASTLVPLIETKRAALLAYNRTTSERDLNKLRAAKSTLQREARRCANTYWENLCADIQMASDTGDIRRMYEKIRTALGPQINKVAPLKSLSGEQITDKHKQMERWVEHYSCLYSQERSVDESLQEVIPQLPEMTELDHDPTEDELAKAIDELASGKSSGNDNIPAEILKENKDIILPHIYKLLILCWKRGEIPQDMKDANIVTLYKNKGDKGDCNNYRGISLLNITGKAFARILLRRLQKLSERILPESQCGFRAGRSTMDMIFSLRQLQEKCREQKQPLHMAFVDLTKAFDTVSRSGLYMVLHKIGCPPTLLKLVRSFHEGMKATVQFDGSTSNSFEINSGVKQGCVMAPTLFSIFFAVLLQHAFKESPGDVYLHWRSDGSLFNLARLRAKTKVKRTLIRDLLFADDAALVAHSESTLQIMMEHLSQACKAFSLEISTKKTVTLTQDGTNEGKIILDNKPLEAVKKFCYLGSTITSTTSLDEEINVRIGKAATAFGRLSKRAWNNKMLTMKTKIRIYEACILSTLLYGSETWTLYSRQEKKLNTFHLRCLRRILGITWQDKVTNTEVLKQAALQSMTSILCKRRLRWLGHVKRMDDNRIPKQLLCGELAQGNRSRGRPKLRFKDTCKSCLSKCRIDAKTWEKLAEDRTAWKTSVNKGVKHLEEDNTLAMEEKRQRRKNNKPQPCSTFLACRFCSRTCASNIGRFSHERSCRMKTVNT